MRTTLLLCFTLLAACSTAPQPAPTENVTLYVDSDGDGLPDRVARPEEAATATAWIDTDGDGTPDQRVER